MLLILQDNQAVAMLCTKWAVFYIEMNLETIEVKKKNHFHRFSNPKSKNVEQNWCQMHRLVTCTMSSQHKINHNDITPANDQQCQSNCKVCWIVKETMGRLNDCS